MQFVLILNNLLPSLQKTLLLHLSLLVLDEPAQVRERVCHEVLDIFLKSLLIFLNKLLEDRESCLHLLNHFLLKKDFIEIIFRVDIIESIKGMSNDF